MVGRAVRRLEASLKTFFEVPQLAVARAGDGDTRGKVVKQGQLVERVKGIEPS